MLLFRIIFLEINISNLNHNDKKQSLNDIVSTYKFNPNNFASSVKETELKKGINKKIKTNLAPHHLTLVIKPPNSKEIKKVIISLVIKAKTSKIIPPMSSVYSN